MSIYTCMHVYLHIYLKDTDISVPLVKVIKKDLFVCFS